MPEQWDCATVGRLSGLVCASVPCSVSQELRATTVTASETVGEPNRDHCRSYDQTVGSKGNERREEIAMEASEGQGAAWTGAPRRLFGAKAPPRAGKTVGIVLWDCRCPGARRKSQGLLVHATSRAGNAAGNRVAPTLGKQPHSVKRWVICSQNGGVAPLSTCIRVSPTNNDRIMPFIFVMVGCCWPACLSSVPHRHHRQATKRSGVGSCLSVCRQCLRMVEGRRRCRRNAERLSAMASLSSGQAQRNT